jgi:bacterioferritin
MNTQKINTIKDQETVIKTLNQLLENEYAGVVRYSHYSLMVFGFNRIPIVKWFRDQSAESLTHAEGIGEMITTFGGHPSLKISALLETHKHSLEAILTETLVFEKDQVKVFHDLLGLVEGHSVLLEEFAREMIFQEENHVSEVQKMLNFQK